MRCRVVNLGLPKSGTSTLARALTEAGLKVADFKIRRTDTKDPTLAGTFVARQMYDGFYEHGDPLHSMDAFDAFTEISVINQKRGVCLWPQTDFALIDAIRQRHPELRFVASWRPADAHARSMMRWNNLGTERLPKNQVPGLPQGYGRNADELARWIAGHHAHLRAIFDGDPRFLEYDTSDPEAPAKIAAHLGITLPWWGVENANPRTTQPG